MCRFNLFLNLWTISLFSALVQCLTRPSLQPISPRCTILNKLDRNGTCSLCGSRRTRRLQYNQQRLAGAQRHNSHHPERTLRRPSIVRTHTIAVEFMALYQTCKQLRDVLTHVFKIKPRFYDELPLAMDMKHPWYSRPNVHFNELALVVVHVPRSRSWHYLHPAVTYEGTRPFWHAVSRLCNLQTLVFVAKLPGADDRTLQDMCTVICERYKDAELLFSDTGEPQLDGGNCPFGPLLLQQEAPAIVRIQVSARSVMYHADSG